MARHTIATELDRLAQDADRARQPVQADQLGTVLRISHQLPGLAFAAKGVSGGLAAELDRLAFYLDERKTAGRFEFVDYAAVLNVIAERLRELAARASAEDGRARDRPDTRSS